MTQWFTAALALLAITSTAHAVDISECGQLVPRGQTGVLQNDLTCGLSVKRCRDFPEVVCNTPNDCPNRLGCNEGGLFLARNATLDLNGHTITYGGARSAIICRYRGRCAIRNGSVICAALTSSGLWSGSRVSAEDVTFTGCGVGIDANKLNATRVTASGGSTGIYVQHLRAYDVTASDNANLGIVGAGTLRIRTARAERNGQSGVYSMRYDIDGLESHGNGAAGLTGFRFEGRGGLGVIRNSNISGNAYQGQPMDILSAAVPRVENVLCDWSGLWTAGNAPAGPGLGICVQQ